MSFAEALERARHQVQLQKSVSVKQETVSNINTQVKEESLTETNVVTDTTTLGQAMIKISKGALSSSGKFRTTGKCKRIAKRIATGYIEKETLIKSFDLIEKINSKKHDYRLIGGDATLQLLELLKQNIPFDEALRTKYKGSNNE